MKGEGIVNLIKLLGTAGGTGMVSVPFFQLLDQYIRLPVWGVPVTVIGAAACGAALSLFFGDPTPSRKALFGQVLGATFFGAAAAVMAADGLELAWATKNLSMFALMTAAAIRWFLPSVIERIKQMIKDFKLSLPTKKGDR